MVKECTKLSVLLLITIATCLDMHPRFILIRCGKMSDKETTAFEKNLLLSVPKRKGKARQHRVPWGCTRVKEDFGRAWPRAFIVLFAGRKQQGRQV